MGPPGARTADAAQVQKQMPGPFPEEAICQVPGSRCLGSCRERLCVAFVPRNGRLVLSVWPCSVSPTQLPVPLSGRWVVKGQAPTQGGGGCTGEGHAAGRGGTAVLLMDTSGQALAQLIPAQDGLCPQCQQWVESGGPSGSEKLWTFWATVAPRPMPRSTTHAHAHRGIWTQRGPWEGVTEDGARRRPSVHSQPSRFPAWL